MNNPATMTTAPPAETTEETPLWLKAVTGRESTNSLNYLVDLELFQGPMELLLYLIRKEELDLSDIPISKITRQYLKYVEVIKDLNLEAAGDFILMAATLIRIKTKLLLPRDETDPDEPDPREELVMALLEYKRFKEASDSLRDLREEEERLFIPERVIDRKGAHVTEIPGNTVFQLMEALREALTKVSEDHSHHTQHEAVTIQERVERIRDYLEENESATFHELFADAPTKIVVIVTLIAILEMVNARRLEVRQVATFTELRIYRGEHFDDPGEIIVDEWGGAHTVEDKTYTDEEEEQKVLVEKVLVNNE